MTMKPNNPLPPYSLRTVSGPHTAKFTAIITSTITTVSSYLTITETYQPIIIRRRTKDSVDEPITQPGNPHVNQTGKSPRRI